MAMSRGCIRLGSTVANGAAEATIVLTFPKFRFACSPRDQARLRPAGHADVHRPGASLSGHPGNPP